MREYAHEYATSVMELGSMPFGRFAEEYVEACKDAEARNKRIEKQMKAKQAFRRPRKRR